MANSYALPSLEQCFTWQALATVCLGAVLSTILHRRYFSPISDVPGPFFASLTRLWQTREVLLGRGTLSVTALHPKHGPFVRIAPGEVSVSHPEAPRKLLLATLPKVSLPGPGPGPTAGPELRNSTGPLVQSDGHAGLALPEPLQLARPGREEPAVPQRRRRIQHD